MTEAARQITAHHLEMRLDLPQAKDEVRRLGETLNEMMERLESAFQSQKQFVADASHEIRTPLAVIRTELELALHQSTDPLIQASIQSSLAEVDRMTHMTGQLLTLARLDSSASDLDLVPLRPDELLVECVQLSMALAAKKETQISVFVEEAIEISADREKLKSVIMNLLDNAIKYSPDGSRVGASLRVCGRPATAIKIVVEDNGPGIDEADLARIFKRFYRGVTARGEGGGSGLGLAIAQRIVELHHGTLSVCSETGVGTSFTVELPASAEV
jgi:signal transduction histidine kinase